MRQKKVPYWKWEDYINGMYRPVEESKKEMYIEIAIKFMTNYCVFGSVMRQVVFEWPNTMLNSLTNTSLNRRAFVGQCAVNYKLGIPNHITKEAWKLIPSHIQDEANKEADEAIKLWLEKYENT